MTIEIPIFDPQKPEEFTPLSLKDTREIRYNDSAAHEKYGHELNKYNEWKAEEEKRKHQLPNPVYTEDRSYSNRTARAKMNLIMELGRAVANAGFQVKYMNGHYRGNYEVHPTWANVIYFYKEGERVGEARVWVPKSGWSYQPVGWIIETNRGIGNPRSTWNRKEKRLKKLDSAIKYIKETAVPKRSYEDDIESAKRVIEGLRQKIRKANNEIAKLNGGARNYGDTILKELLIAQEKGERDTMWELLDERNKAIAALATKVHGYHTDVVKIEEEVLKPLLEKAEKELPEFYQ